MTTLAIAVNVSNPDAEDRQTMEYYITQENERRAALVPPEAPLLMSTAGERKTSYETLLNQVAADVHTHRINQAKQAAEATTPRDVKVAYASASAGVQGQIRTLLGLSLIHI